MTPGAAPATRQAALDFTTNREVRLHDEPHRHWWGKFKSLLRQRRNALGAPFWLFPYVVFSHTEMCDGLVEVNGSRVQVAQRSLSVMPACRAMRSSSEGHTYL